MSEFLDVWISREWGVSPESVRAWPASDVERVVAMLGAEGKAAEYARRRNG